MNISEKIIEDYELKVAPFYKSAPRLAQVQMSLDIADFLFNSNRRVMFVEAPVGTGKTLGVLIPSYLYAQLNGKKLRMLLLLKICRDKFSMMIFLI